MEELKMPPTKAQRPHCIGPENGLLFKLRFQNSENFVHGVLFEVGFLDQCFTCNASTLFAVAHPIPFKASITQSSISSLNSSR